MAFISAVLAVILLLVGVREPEVKQRHAGQAARMTFADARRLDLQYWRIVLLGGVFTLARFSEAFLVLRAQSVGLGAGSVPVVVVVMHVVYAASAYPAGIAADRMSRQRLLLLGLGVLIVSDLVLAAAAVPWHVLVGATLWGLHMGFTQGLLSKLVADSAPAELRGTAFGVFSLVTGVALLLASVVAGLLWQSVGPSATFIAGAAFAALAAAGIWAYPPRPRTSQHA